MSDDLQPRGDGSTDEQPNESDEAVKPNDGEDATAAPTPVKPPAPALKSPFAELVDLPLTTPVDDIRKVVNRCVEHEFQRYQVPPTTNVILFFDPLAIDRNDADRIYKALSKAGKANRLLLVLHSPGGDVASAYFIGKLCREYSERFEVVVPRRAKSAATLICCAADRIHMGALSELGPIDPQIEGRPALAVKHSVEHLAELATTYSGANTMLSDYLAKSLPIELLGYYERAARSAVQYAERLLAARVCPTDGPLTNAEIANRLVYEYKDHGFAIDSGEAATIFGEAVVRNAEEYDLGNRFYMFLDLLRWFVEDKFQHQFAFSGSCSDGAVVRANRPLVSVRRSSWQP